MKVESRVAAQSDASFLYELHKVALGPYVKATWGWDEAFQRRWFEERFAPTANQLILIDGSPGGCLRVSEQSDCLFLDYIAVLPEHQRRGVGSQLIRKLQDRAVAKSLPVRLSVLKVNPAKALYERMGFRVTGDDDVRWFMEFAG